MNRITSLKSMFALVLLAVLPSMTTAATETITWIHTDHLGSPIAGRNAAGETTWEQAYAPWGEKQAMAGVPEAPAGVSYTGHVYDEQVGLIYAGARWYDPGMGRFLSPDSIRSHQSHPFDLNRFSYVYNSPYYYTDPTGDAGYAAGAVIGAVVVCSRVSACVHLLGGTLAGGAAFLGYNSESSSDSSTEPRTGAKDAPESVLEEDADEWIYGPEDDPKVTPEGGTTGRTWATPDDYGIPSEAQDKLDPFKPLTGRRPVKIPAGTKIKRGRTPGGEGPYNGSGGGNETLVEGGLPSGSVGPWEPL